MFGDNLSFISDTTIAACNGQVLLYQIMPSVFENLFTRFGEEDITNGRDEIFLFYTEHILSSPQYFFFGIGIQSVVEKIQMIHDTQMSVPHNGLQEAVVVWGIVGLVLMLCLLLALFRASRGTCKRRAVALVPFAIWGLYMMTCQLVTASTTLLALLLIFVFLVVEGRGEDVPHGE